MHLLEFYYSHFIIYGTGNDKWYPKINIYVIQIRPNFSSHMIHLPLPCLHVFRAKGTTVRNYLEVTGGYSHIEVPEITNPSPTCNNNIGLANRFSNSFYSWFLFNNEPDALTKFILSQNSTCFGHLLCSSSGVLYCTFGTGKFHAGFWGPFPSRVRLEIYYNSR